MANDVQARDPWYWVDMRLVTVKAIYFFFLAAVGDLLPFIPVYMKQLGLTPTEAGVIYGVMPFIAFFVKPLFGLIADKTHRHKAVLMLSTFLTGVFYCLLLATPHQKNTSWTSSVITQISCNPQDSFIKDCVELPKNGTMLESSLKSCDRSLKQFATEHLDGNSSDVKCEISCGVSFTSSLALQGCFTNDVGTLQADICDGTWNHSMTKDLDFAINDLSSVVQDIISEENNTYSGQSCINYDLKNVSYGDKPYWQLLCDSESIFDCKLSCGPKYKKSCMSVTEKLSSTFWIFFFIFLFSNIFFSPVISLIDAIAYDILGEKRGNWGMQRLWGTVGFILFALTSTFIMDNLNKKGDVIDYSPSFYIFLGLTSVTTIVTYFLKFSEDFQCNPMLKNVIQLFKIPKVTLFMIIVALFGVLNVVIEGFLFWYLTDLGSSQIVLGLCLFFNCVPEVFIFFVTGKIIKKIGHLPCFYLSALGYMIRFIVYSFLKDPLYVLPVELLHCLTFAVFYAAASGYASIITPPGTSATVQGLLGGIYFGFSKGVGSLVTGKMFDRETGLGPVWTFRFYAVFSAVLLIICVLVQVFFFKKTTIVKETPELESKNNVDKATGDHLLGSPVEEREESEARM